MKRSLIIILFLIPVYTSFGDTAVINWLNSARKNYSLPALKPDSGLSFTAIKYSQKLLKNAELSHIDKNGRNGLDRYRKNGGTSLRVGEIIGAGNSIARIEKAWLKSGTHREVILDPYWTNCGIGVSVQGNIFIVVVMFTRIYTKNLKLQYSGTNLALSGIFLSRFRKNIKNPLLFSGFSSIKPSRWNPGSGEFTFIIDVKKLSPYIRLGYITADDRMVFSDILNPDFQVTSFPKKEHR
ncbi:MAG: CAP domain-containing protein [Spirochaetes bacterium]|nr:CAP domain-containing protein [Spirochaetota bacterium]